MLYSCIVYTHMATVGVKGLLVGLRTRVGQLRPPFCRVDAFWAIFLSHVGHVEQ